MIRDAEKNGQAAFEAGLPVSTNPYAAGVLFHVWRDAWIKARALYELREGVA